MHAGRGDATRALDYYVGLLMVRAKIVKVILDSRWPSAGGCPAASLLLSAGGNLAILFTC